MSASRGRRSRAPCRSLRHAAVVVANDVEALPLADTVAQLVGPGAMFHRRLLFAQVRVHGAQPSVRQREVWIEFDRAAEERNRLLIAAGVSLLVAEAERLECLERRGRRLIDRLVHPLDRGQRFAEPFAHGRGRGSHRRQHLLFARGAHLFPRQHVASLAILGRQRDDEGASPASRCRRASPP